MEEIKHFEHELTYVLELKYRSKEEKAVIDKATDLCRAFIFEIYQHVENHELNEQMGRDLTQCLQAVID